MKYNYKKANILWLQLSDYLYLMSTTKEELQQEHRQFLYDLTRGNDKSVYINYLLQEINERRPVSTAKSRCYDFEEEKTIKTLINDIINFTN